jgi:hypothetical protein
MDLHAKRDPLPVRLKNFWFSLQGGSEMWKSRSVGAVCVPLGYRLLVRDSPELLQREIGVQRTEQVTFTQKPASSSRYRDAIRFRNGREILLQRLREGQRARVLDLSLANFADPFAEFSLGLSPQNVCVAA